MNVTLFTSKNCPKCAALKRWLKRHKVSFKEKSIDDTDVMTELVMHNLVVLAAPALSTENRFFMSHQIFRGNSLDPDFIKNLEKPK